MKRRNLGFSVALSVWTLAGSALAQPSTQPQPPPATTQPPPPRVVPPTTPMPPSTAPMQPVPPRSSTVPSSATAPAPASAPPNTFSATPNAPLPPQKGPTYPSPIARTHAEPPPGSMKLEDAVNLALTKNERVKIADLNDKVAAAAVERARTGFLPVLQMTASDQQHPDDTPKTGAVTNIGTAAVQFNQPVVNVPAWPLYYSAKASYEGQLEQTIDDKRIVAFDTTKAFLNVLNAQEVLIAAYRRKKSAENNLDDTQARAEAQLTSSNDVTRAQIALASSAREVEQDKGQFDAALVALEFLVNAALPKTLAPPAAMLDASKLPVPPMQQLLQTAIDLRPDVKAKKHLAQAAHDSASEPLLRIIPTLNLTGQANTSTNTPTGNKQIDEFLGLSLQWTIYDAGARYADKHQRDALAEIADLNVVALVRNVDAQVKSAIVTLVAAQNALKEAEKAVTSSQQSADETAILYRQGLAKAIELVDAEDQVFLAEVNYVSAEYSMAQAYIALRQALGLMPTGTELK